MFIKEFSIIFCLKFSVLMKLPPSFLTLPSEELFQLFVQLSKLAYMLTELAVLARVNMKMFLAMRLQWIFWQRTLKK